MAEDLLTVPEAAEAVNLTERWMRRAIFEGRIEVVKFGRLVRIPRSSLEKLIEDGRKPSRSA
jgi:excisionase family DNA binding protein